MKKLLCILLCLMLLLPSALADTPPRKLEESDPLYTSLRERAMEYAGLFDEAVHSEEYLDLIHLPDAAKDELALVQMQDFTQPLDVAIVRTDDAFAVYQPFDPHLMLYGADVSDALKTLTWQRLYSSAGAFLVSDGDASMLTLSSLLRYTDAFMLPEAMDGPCFAVMQYGGLYAFLVTFVPTANGAVIATAQCIPSRSADELNLPAE